MVSQSSSVRSPITTWLYKTYKAAIVNKKYILMITKELFISTIEKLREQYDHDRQCSDAFRTILKNDYVSGYDNSLAFIATVKLLEALLNDKYEFIEYYMWEVNFGRDAKPDDVIVNGKPYHLNTPEALWYLLTEEVNVYDI